MLKQIYIEDEVLNISVYETPIISVDQYDLSYTTIDMEPIILSQTNRVIKKVYHIGDIHIRRNSRTEEYNKVFYRLYERIKEDAEDSVIVCCGDVLHEGLSPDAIVMVKSFFIRLATLMDVICIIGNHDLSSRSDMDATDFLSPLLMKLDTKHKIHMLLRSGLYEYENIIFGMTSMHADRVVSANGYFNGKTKIALWHGMIHGSRNKDDYILSNTKMFNVGDFSDYHAVMLGDIHHLNYFRNKTIAYCSSLIQQSFGETIENHGAIKWFVDKPTHITNQYMHIPNDYGFLTLRIEKNKCSKYDIDSLPANIRLRILQKSSDDDYVTKVKDDLAKRVNIIDYKLEKLDTNMIITIGSKKESLNRIKSDDMALSILDSHMQNNYNFNDEDQQAIKNTIGDLMKKIKYDYNTAEKVIKLLRLTFDNFNVYGEGNAIDYDKLKGIINISGPNHIGKSSAVVYVMLYALYGDFENGVGKYDYVNIKKRFIKTSIEFMVNDTKYRIERDGIFRGKNRHDFTPGVILYKDGKDISGKNIKAIEDQIKLIIGDIYELTNLSIMGQKQCDSFLNRRDGDKKTYLCNIMKLNIYNNVAQEALAVSRGLNIRIAERNKIIYRDTKIKNSENDRGDILTRDIAKLKHDTELLVKLNEENSKELDILSRKKMETEIRLEAYADVDTYHDATNYNSMAKKNQNIIDMCEADICALQTIINTKTNDSKILNDKINKMGDMISKKENFDNEKNKKIAIIDAEIKSLSNERINVKQINDIGTIKTSLDTFNKIDEKLNETINAKVKSINGYRKKISNKKFSKTLDTNYEEFNKIKDNISSITEQIKIATTELKEYKRRLNTMKNHRYSPTCPDCMANKTTQNKITLTDKISEIQILIDGYNKELETANIRYDKYKKYEIMYNERDEINKNNDTYRNLIEKESHDLDIVKKDLEINNIKLNNAMKIIDEYNESIDIIKNNKAIDAKIKKNNILLKELREQQYDEYNVYVKLLSQLKKIDDEIANDKKKLFDIKHEFDQHIKERDEIKVKIAKWEEEQRKKQEYQRLIDELLEITRDHKIISQRIDNNAITIKENNNKIISYECELKNVMLAKDDIKRFERDKMINDKIVSIINGGLVDDILKYTILPQLERMINQILQSFVNYNVKMVYENNQSIRVYKDEDGMLTNALQLSGHEALICNMAIRLSLNQINKSLRTNFFIMDESLSFCDDKAIAKVANLFDYMREIYDWVIVITHNDQVKHYTDTDISIEKRDGFSYINTNKYNVNNENTKIINEDKPKHVEGIIKKRPKKINAKTY